MRRIIEKQKTHMFELRALVGWTVTHSFLPVTVKWVNLHVFIWKMAKLLNKTEHHQKKVRTSPYVFVMALFFFFINVRPFQAVCTVECQKLVISTAFFRHPHVKFPCQQRAEQISHHSSSSHFKHAKQKSIKIVNWILTTRENICVERERWAWSSRSWLKNHYASPSDIIKTNSQQSSERVEALSQHPNHRSLAIKRKIRARVFDGENVWVRVKIIFWYFFCGGGLLSLTQEEQRLKNGK